MTGYLDAALRRMALPIRVTYREDTDAWWVGSNVDNHAPYPTVGEAAEAYVRRARELDPTES